MWDDSRKDTVKINRKGERETGFIRPIITLIGCPCAFNSLTRDNRLSVKSKGCTLASAAWVLWLISDDKEGCIPSNKILSNRALVISGCSVRNTLAFSGSDTIKDW